MATIKVKKGGNFRLVINSPATDDTFTIPAGYQISSIVAEKNGTSAATLSIGTSSGGTQIVNAAALGTTDKAFVPCTIVKSAFETKTTAYITLSAAGAASRIFVTLRRLT